MLAGGGGGGVGYSPQILVGMCRGKVKNGGLRTELERENAGLRSELERESRGLQIHLLPEAERNNNSITYSGRGRGWHCVHEQPLSQLTEGKGGGGGVRGQIFSQRLSEITIPSPITRGRGCWCTWTTPQTVSRRGRGGGHLLVLLLWLLFFLFNQIINW